MCFLFYNLNRDALHFPYLGLLPAGEVDVVGEEVGHALLRHLALQRLQQVREPLEGLCLRAQPVEVDLRAK